MDIAALCCLKQKMDQVLLALPGSVRSMKVLDAAASRADVGCEAVLVLTDDSLLLVGVDGGVLSTICMPSKNDTKKRKKSVHPVDAVYLEGLRSVLVALSDDSLVHVPLMAMTSSSPSLGSDKLSISANIDMGQLERCAWGIPILSVSTMGTVADGRTACLVRTADAVATVMLATASSSPSLPVGELKLGKVLCASSHRSGHISALVASAKKGSPKLLLSWRSPTEGWLSTDAATACAVGEAMEGYEAVGAYASLNCTFITLRSSNGAKDGQCFRLLKCGATGVLFQRELPEGVPGSVAFTAVLENAEHMEVYFLDNEKNLRSWCGRYGCPRAQWSTTEKVEVKAPTTKTATKAKRGRGVGDADTLQSLSVTNGPEVTSNSEYAVGGVPGSPTLYRIQTSSGGSSLVRVSLGGGAAKPLGLLGALGSLPRANSKIIPQMIRLFDSQQSISTLDSSKEPQESGAKGKGVLGALPRPMKRKLQQLTQWRTKFTQDQDIEDIDDSQSPLKHARSVTTQPPFDGCVSFLKEFQACESSQEVFASDWDVVLTLLTTQRCISLQHPHNTSLMDFSLSAGRLDVLCCAARYAPDLSEAQAVCALIRLAMWDPSSSTGVHAMKHLRLNKTGALEWHSKGIQTTASALKTPSKGKGKGKAKGKGKGKDDDEEAVRDPQSSGALELTHLDVLRVLTESLLRRSGGFSVQLLADAIQEHTSPTEAGLLLHLFLLFLRGLCGGADAQFFGFVHDQQVARAVDWSEAILDAHFCGIALSTSSGSGTNGPLEGALQVAASLLSAQGISAGEEGIEQALGAWTHIWRSARRLKEATDAGQTRATLRPPGGMYRLEKLVF